MSIGPRKLENRRERRVAKLGIEPQEAERLNAAPFGRPGERFYTVGVLSKI